jgi:hypothetical protein
MSSPITSPRQELAGSPARSPRSPRGPVRLNKGGTVGRRAGSQLLLALKEISDEPTKESEQSDSTCTFL